MPRNRMKIGELVVYDGIILENILNDQEILTLLEGIGYTKADIEQGKKLQQKALQLHLKQKSEHKEDHEAMEMLYDTWDTARAVYRRHWRIARLVFQDDPDSSNTLALTGTHSYQLANWLAKAYRFYENVLSSQDIQQKLAKRGVSKNLLEEGLKLIQAVEAAKKKQENEHDDIQEDIRLHNEAVDILNEWMTEFLEYTKIAFEDRPPLLDKLGLTF